MAGRVSKKESFEGRRVAELFAGVGGFRLGLEGLEHPNWPDWASKDGSGWKVVWSNQWEPSTKVQHASDCYVQRFGPEGHVCDDIAAVMDRAESGEEDLPDFDLLVGGFPCQDYSVAKVLSQSTGIDGKKGVLWWQIHRLLELRRPRNILLENVDRLLKSPASQRGRDFAIMLWSLQALGYCVEWRVVNAADYGFPQRRRRVFIVGHRLDQFSPGDAREWLFEKGVLAGALPIQQPAQLVSPFRLDADIPQRVTSTASQLRILTESFGAGLKRSPFETAGVMFKGEVWTSKAEPVYEEETPLKKVLVPDSQVPEEFFIREDEVERWEWLKGSKKELRNGRDGFTYFYNEGPVAFPEPLSKPSRTLLTGEGGRTPSRFKHVVKQPRGRLRRLTPVELERLNGFPDGWTDTGMPDAKRAFMMGNALVVGVVRRIGQRLAAL